MKKLKDDDIMFILFILPVGVMIWALIIVGIIKVITANL